MSWPVATSAWHHITQAEGKEGQSISGTAAWAMCRGSTPSRMNSTKSSVRLFASASERTGWQGVNQTNSVLITP